MPWNLVINYGGKMSGSKYTSDFTSGRVAPALVKFATPLFLASLLQVVYNMVDMIIVGQVHGEVGLSAVSVGGDVSNLLTFVAMGFANAGQVILSQLLGAGRREKISSFIGTMCSFLGVSAVVLSVVGFFLRDVLLKIMNTPAEAYEEALAYSTVCIIGMIFIYGYNASSAILRGMGDAKHPFMFIAIASVINVVLDIVFVIGMGMGAAGAAYATVISQAVSFILSVVFIYKNMSKYDLEFKKSDFMITAENLSPLIKLGVPMAIKNAAIQISRLFVNSFINSYGVTVSAFAGVANKINSISNLISNSFNAAGSSMVGQNIGSRKYERVPKILGTVGGITGSVALIFTVVTLAFPEAVFGIFTSDPNVIAVGYTYLPVAALIFFGSALRAIANSLINGSGNTGTNFATAILDGIVFRIGYSLLFGIVLEMGALGFWLGDALAGFTPFFIGIWLYLSGRWKKENIRLAPIPNREAAESSMEDADECAESE